MTTPECKLFEEMLGHHIKSFTQEDEHQREFHREMYEVTKHVLWGMQKEKRKND